MQQWIDLKTLLVSESGLDGDTLRVLASVPAHFACALMARRPVASFWPWLLLLALAGGNEAATVYRDRLIDAPELPAAARDLALTMVLPTFLLIAAYVGTLFPRSRVTRATVQFAPPQAPPADAIVDAEFEEID